MSSSLRTSEKDQRGGLGSSYRSHVVLKVVSCHKTVKESQETTKVSREQQRRRKKQENARESKTTATIDGPKCGAGDARADFCETTQKPRYKLFLGLKKNVEDLKAELHDNDELFNKIEREKTSKTKLPCLREITTNMLRARNLLFFFRNIHIHIYIYIHAKLTQFERAFRCTSDCSKPPNFLPTFHFAFKLKSCLPRAEIHDSFSSPYFAGVALKTRTTFSTVLSSLQPVLSRCGSQAIYQSLSLDASFPYPSRGTAYLQRPAKQRMSMIYWPFTIFDFCDLGSFQRF